MQVVDSDDNNDSTSEEEEQRPKKKGKVRPHIYVRYIGVKITIHRPTSLLQKS
jgi:hypothetical protein